MKSTVEKSKKKNSKAAADFDQFALRDAAQWDAGELGQDERFVKKAAASAEKALDGALNLEAISIRLSKDLIDQYKKTAGVLGVGYQPLMRDAIERMSKTYMQEAIKVLQEKKESLADKPSITAGKPLKKAA
jgi:predicted DNA binding CopG/RHH family protein